MLPLRELSFAATLFVFIAASADAAPPATRPGAMAGVASILEENAAELLPLLTNPTGDPGEGHVEAGQVFTGKSAIRIVPLQRFSPRIAGWEYRIVERPAAPDEYRYLRFAWKVDGSTGCMLQLHDDKDWNIRYCAGNNGCGWGTKFVADKPPKQWTLVTIDLFKDFGERTIRGIALTTFDGKSGYFDHIYFGRSVEALDRIDATGIRAANQPPVRLAPAELDRLWDDLADADAAKSYRAFWMLVADPDRAAPFLKKKLATAGADDIEQLRRCIVDLGDEAAAVRERAMDRLKANIHAAAGLLEAALADDPPPESHRRIEALLRFRKSAPPRADPTEKAMRALEYCSGR
jgi:hypothetical protein